MKGNIRVSMVDTESSWTLIDQQNNYKLLFSKNQMTVKKLSAKSSRAKRFQFDKYVLHSETATIIPENFMNNLLCF